MRSARPFLVSATVALLLIAGGAILWITRTTIIHHTGFDPFFGFKK